MLRVLYDVHERVQSSGKGRGLSDFGVEEIRGRLQDRNLFGHIYVRMGNLEESPILILSDVYILIFYFFSGFIILTINYLLYRLFKFGGPKKGEILSWGPQEIKSIL